MNPALADLEPLLGHWDAAFDFPTDPPGQLAGQVAFEAVEGGAFVAMRSWPDKGGPPLSISLIGRDDASGAYTVLYADERGVSRVYAMTFDGGTWAMEGKPEAFWQRFRAEVSGDLIRGAWEASDDGRTWRHDFALTYSRRGRYP